MRKSSCSSAASSRIRRRGSWTPEEDQKLLAFIQQHGHGNWHSLPQKAGLQRCGKSCRLRWINYLRPDIKRGNFSLHEDQTIIRLHALLGNRWSAIAAQLPKRTDNEIKNYWNTNLKKRLAMIGLDPVTHKPKATANVLASAGGGDPKYLSNLTHIAQWESTRLQAEASFSRNYSKLTRRHDDITIPPPASDSSLELEYLYYCKPDHDHHESAAAVPPPQWYYDIPTAWESVLLSKSIAAAAAPGGEDGGGVGGATNVTQDPVSFGPATLICAASISSMVDNAETTTGSLDFNQVLGQLGNEYYCTTSTSTRTSPPTTQLLAALHRNMGFGSFEVRGICLDDFGTIL